MVSSTAMPRQITNEHALEMSSDVSQALEAANDLVEDFDDEGLLLGVGLRVNLIGPIDFFGEIEQLTDDFELVHVGVTLGF